jgi:hypothetical protein
MKPWMPRTAASSDGGGRQHGDRLAALGDDDLIDFMRPEAIEDFQALGLELGCIDSLDIGHELAYRPMHSVDQSDNMTIFALQGKRAYLADQRRTVMSNAMPKAPPRPTLSRDTP